jgi:hypothetical protein
MRVKLGNYKNYVGPYQLAEILCFWSKKEKDEFGIPRKPDWVHNFGEWLAYGSVRPEPEPGEIYSLFNDDRTPTLLYRFLSWIHSKQSRTIDVRIDPWDTWSMDSTLGYIIRPMLRQLKETKHGAPMVDLEDVPENLRPSAEEQAAYQKDGTADEKFFERWDWVIGEMIFAFDSLDGGPNQDWEEQFTTGKYDFRFKKIDTKGTSEMIHGPNHTAETDWDSRKAYAKRIENGFRLFGKYFQSLWT